MFNFLFGKSKPALKPETKRERFHRLVEELNEMIDELPKKPKLTFDPETGHIEPETPDQFQDEALALPKPLAEKAETAPAGTGKAEMPAKPDASKEAAIAAKVEEGDGAARTGHRPKVMPGTPVPQPPRASAE